MTGRLIDAEYLKKYIRENGIYCDTDADKEFSCKVIDSMPTVDAEPVRHGKWIKLDMHAHLADHKCTACGQECYVPTCTGEPMYTYCPNCGARMDAERREENGK